ncbi:MAG TPA: ABC transporter ATP-binding protein [Candidatus Omnitrophota bacterium]|nr:ABC transporter ATP-binding protein [Candidatus Omnitrophota bacterium]
MNDLLLKVNDLTVTVHEGGRPRNIIESVGFEVPKLGIVALVGGSGSGKTTTGLAILRLLQPALSITGGEILFEGSDLLRLSADEMRRLRGASISMVFQEPLDAFNPVFSIGYQINEVLTFHTQLNNKQKRERLYELLDLVGLPEPKQIAKNYPHQLSGGMRQRAMIAQAIAANPKLMIADEPTSNLDVTLQAKIMELFQKLRNELNLSVLLITHDLGMVEHMADHVVVMKAGSIVESDTTQAIVEKPKHEYTRQLIKAFQV